MSDDDKKVDANDAVSQMFNMWRDGSEAFMKANMELAENVQKSFAEATDAMKPADNDPAEAWQAFLKSWAPTWDPASMMNAMKSADFTPDFMGSFGDMSNSFGAGKEAFFAMMDPSVWTKHAPEQLRKILETVSAGPRFADLATPQMDAATSWREMVDYNSAMSDFAKVIQQAWVNTYKRFAEDYSIDDLQTGDTNKALQEWLKIANEELLETQRSSEFLDAQRRLLRAGTEIQARQRDIAEAWSANYQMPTRTEIDDLSRIVHELRREVRSLKREVSALQSTQTGGKK